MIKYNKVFLIISCLCIISIIYALYAEYYLHLNPCPLCIAQRILIGIIGVCSLIFAIHNPQSWLKYVYNLLIAGLTIYTIKIATHHVWLINLPPEKQPLSCGMPLKVLYERLPLRNFLNLILQGDAECGKVNWYIMGLNAPTAVIIFCAVILLLIIYNIVAIHKK